MSRKEFDAKQFLLEKGEQVGLGVAVTLMVVMLIINLFIPPHGFFSGSPKAKAEELRKSTEQLETALRTREPGPSDLPEKREGKLIALDTEPLNPDNYATELWFEPRMKEDKLRRPPKIYNVEEAVAKVAAIPIDTYLFRFTADGVKVGVLEDKSRRAAAPTTTALPGGRSNNILSLLKGFPAQGGGMPNNPLFQRQQRQLADPTRLSGLQALMGAVDNTDYDLKWVPADNWDPQQGTTAHQLRPLRMAIIAGSFPYKKQLEEHRAKLRLASIDDVLNETVGEKKTPAFEFRGVEVQRMEVDADGKPVSDWQDPQLKESYELWLKNTFLPFEEEDHKYEPVMPNGGAGLVMPLLREFHAGKGGVGAFPPLGTMPTAPAQLGAQARQPEAPSDQPKTHYPDVAAELPKIKDTLDKIQEAQPKQIAQTKFRRPEILDVFNRNVASPSDNTSSVNPNNLTGTAGAEQSYVPDYVLARIVDVTVDPGKYYRYRLKIKMANPNYQRSDVASPEYKEKEVLESSEWYELPQIVKVPEELFYYVVDETQSMSQREINALPPESAQWRLLKARAPSPTTEQVVFQFHRWVEMTQQNRRDTELIPVGEWAVAERVFVARGEYVGRKVNVDIPIWKFTQNRFILPAERENKINRRVGKLNTGIDVDFGLDPPENNLILVDFEGGRGVSVPSPFAANKSISEDCAVEVLMLAPDGKLLARNSAKDSNDEERKKRREEVLKRIQDVREGRGLE